MCLPTFQLLADWGFVLIFPFIDFSRRVFFLVPHGDKMATGLMVDAVLLLFI